MRAAFSSAASAQQVQQMQTPPSLQSAASTSPATEPSPPPPSSPPSSPPQQSSPSHPYLHIPRSNSSLPSSASPSPSSSRFRLTSHFVDSYRSRPAPFGYNGLGELVYLRTYSRKKLDGSQESWAETVERVVNGTYSMQKAWIESHRLGWNARKAQQSAQEMYRRIWEMKFLPPGRGLWAMGSPITEERRLFAALNNCAFVSTEALREEPSKPFAFLMDASMLGVGVGFDTKGAGSVIIKGPSSKTPAAEPFVIPDSREGWVESLRLVLDAFFLGRPLPVFSFAAIRPFGTPIQGFGGLASGPEALQELLRSVSAALEQRVGQPLSVRDIVDIMNYIGRCVVAGNVRRCLPGDALVHTKQGLVPICEVRAGQEVLTSAGFKRVTEQVAQGKQALVRIVTEDGVFRCTPTHRMAVLHDLTGSYVWKRAEELQAGDRLLSSRVPIPGTETQLPPWRAPKLYAMNVAIAPPALDTGMAWFIGLFMANGCSCPNYAEHGIDGYVSLRFYCSQAAIAGIVAKAKTQLRRFGAGLGVERYQDDDEFFTLRCESSQLACYLDQHVKQAAMSAVVPPWIQQATLANRQAFIAGVLDACDGATERPLSVVNHATGRFTRDLQRLLYSCGVESRVSPSAPLRPLDSKSLSRLHLVTSHSVATVAAFPELCKKLRVGAHCQQANGFPAQWCNSLLPALGRQPGPPQQKELRQFSIDAFNTGVAATPYCPVAVLRVEADGSEATFDLSVESQHEFYVDGLLSHNTAEIAFGEPDSSEYLDLKNYSINPQRAAHGWTSNNSVFAKLGMDYTQACDRVRINGEPGFAWLENMQRFGVRAAAAQAGTGSAHHALPLPEANRVSVFRVLLQRMNGVEDGRDHRARGGNPCLEQTLESYEIVLPGGDLPCPARGPGRLQADAQVRLPLRQDGDAGQDALARHQPRHAAQQAHRLLRVRHRAVHLSAQPARAAALADRGLRHDPALRPHLLGLAGHPAQHQDDQRQAVGHCVAAGRCHARHALPREPFLPQAGAARGQQRPRRRPASGRLPHRARGRRRPQHLRRLHPHRRGRGRQDQQGRVHVGAARAGPPSCSGTGRTTRSAAPSPSTRRPRGRSWRRRWTITSTSSRASASCRACSSAPTSRCRTRRSARTGTGSWWPRCCRCASPQEESAPPTRTALSTASATATPALLSLTAAAERLRRPWRRRARARPLCPDARTHCPHALSIA